MTGGHGVGGGVRVERRVVTILFADLVGFTSLSERLDPEDVAAIQDRYFALAHAELTSRGGRVEKYIGDAVFGAFGVPHASGHDAADAVGAGLAVVEAVRGLGSELGLPTGTLEVRVGLTTGAVVVTFGTGTDWRLTGDAVNVAARLQSATDPGTVLVDAPTALAVEGTFDIAPAGALELKGKSEPVPAWWVTGGSSAADLVGPAGDPARPERGGSGRRAPLAGRARELALLGTALTDSGPRRRLVVAPPGAGKTRLVQEFAGRAAEAGRPVRYTRVPVTPGSGYEPIAGLMRAAGIVPYPEMARHLARGGEPGPREERAARFVTALLEGRPLDATPDELFASWTTVLEANAGEADAIWIIDDAHLVGPDLVGFLTQVTDRPHSPLVICSGRPEAAEILGWTGDALLHLDPLDRAATLTLLDGLTGPDALPEPVRDAVAAAAGGNPLFVEELVRSWVQAGTLAPDGGGGWTFAGDNAAAPQLPLTVHAIYLGQLDELPPEQRHLVTTVSIPGRTFPARAVPDLGIREPGDSLTRLAGAGVLVGPHDDPVDSDSYTYRHGVLRDVAYASLSRAERASLHLRFARWAQEREPFAGVVDLIATHLDEACRAAPGLPGAAEQRGLAAEAADWLERAAALHLSSSPQRAVQLLHRSVGLTADPGPDLARRLLGLAEGRRRAGTMSEAADDFARAVEAAPDDASVLVDAALGHEQAMLAGRLPRDGAGGRGIALLEAAAQRGGRPWRARVLAALGQARYYGGDVEAGTRTCADALAAARADDDPGALATALLAWRTTRPGPDGLADRLEASTGAAAEARRDGDAETELDASRLRMIDLLESGDADGAAHEQATATALVHALGRPMFSWYPSMWAGMRALLAADRGAGTLVEEFREQGERWGYPDVGQVHAMQLLLFAVDHGLTAATLPRIEADVARAAERAGPQTWRRWSATLAHAYAAAGRTGEAHRLLDSDSAERFAGLPDDLARLHHLCLAADAAHRIGHVEAARVLRELIGPWRGIVVVLGSGAACLGAVDHFLGLAAATVGDTDAARQHLRDGITRNGELGARGWAVRGRMALAATLRATGDPERAGELTRDAAGAAGRLGLPALVS